MKKDKRTGKLAKIKVGDEVYMSQRHDYKVGVCEKITPTGQMTIKYKPYENSDTITKKFTPDGRLFGSTDPWRSMCLSGLLSDNLNRVQYFNNQKAYSNLRTSIRNLSQKLPHAHGAVSMETIKVIDAMTQQFATIFNPTSVKNTPEYTIALTDEKRDRFVFHSNIVHAIEEFVEIWDYEQCNAVEYPKMGQNVHLIVLGVHNEAKPSTILDSGEVIEVLSARLYEDFEIDEPCLIENAHSFDAFLDLAFNAWLRSTNIKFTVGCLSNEDERRDILAHILWPNGLDAAPSIRITPICGGPTSGSRFGKCSTGMAPESERYFVASSFMATTSTVNHCKAI